MSQRQFFITVVIIITIKAPAAAFGIIIFVKSDYKHHQHSCHNIIPSSNVDLTGYD